MMRFVVRMRAGFLGTFRCRRNFAVCAEVTSRLEKFEAEKVKVLNEMQLARGLKGDTMIMVTVSNAEFEMKVGDTCLNLLGKMKGMKNGPEIPQNIVGVRINGGVFDLNACLEVTSKVEFISGDSEVGHSILWHSSAHVLGQALERIEPGSKLTDGPALKLSQGGGFYYDVWIPNGGTITSEKLSKLQEECLKIISEKQNFERLKVTKNVALDMFRENPFKIEIINNITDDITVYKSGSLVDLCRGPHIGSTRVIGAFELLRTSSVVSSGQSLSRIYGISFTNKKRLAEYHAERNLALQRDHRTIGTAQSLFLFHPFSPGSVFLLPHGVRIYNKLVHYLRHAYTSLGYLEVMTPIMFSHKLWQKSGHWDHYAKDMFVVTDKESLMDEKKLANIKKVLSGNTVVENAESDQNISAESDDVYCLKPMNCPGHCLIFASQIRSYRDLPLRLADFSPLHRNEASGALSGLTRVRRFEQDDAHIFCTPEQIQGEISNCLEFIYSVYSKLFGMSFEIKLATRPDGFLGEISKWEEAESALKQALKDFEAKMKSRSIEFRWEVSAGDGAFYGPKLDIAVTDAMGRSHQCATVQLDFQLPLRFQLKYKDKDGFSTPVMIHRAIMGSFQRILAILTEHTGGRWPFWLNPRQIMVCPVTDSQRDYSLKIYERLKKLGYYCDIGDDSMTLNKRIRDAQQLQYNYILVIGEREVQTNTITVRNREGDVKDKNLTFDEFLNGLKSNDTFENTIPTSTNML